MGFKIKTQSNDHPQQNPLWRFAERDASLPFGTATKKAVFHKAAFCLN